ncbi:MAG TPA: hypothetical protein PKC03_05175 [Dokdonella sp.]|nr:hypothetical protein [Dokdonella sp.]
MPPWDELNSGDGASAGKIYLRRAKLSSIVVSLLFLSSLIGIKYVTKDDFWEAMWAWSGDWFAVGWQISAATGRLYKPAMAFLFVPYAIDHPAYYLLTYLGPILGAAILAAKLFQRVIPLTGLGTLYMILFFGLAQNSFEHNPFSAVPFVWEMTWVLLLLSALMLIRAIEKRSLATAILGAIICLTGMIEPFVPYVFLFGAIAFFSDGGLRKNARYLVPYAAGITMWMVAWLWWRHVHPSIYDGSYLSGSILPTRILRTIWVYATGTAPFATLWNDSVVATVSTFKEGFGVAWISKAAFVGAGAIFIAKAIAMQPRWRVPWQLYAVSVALIFLPVALLGLTPKYQYWVELGSKAYVYSHFSYFAWIALLALLLIPLLQSFRSSGFLAAFALLVAAGSILTDWSNYETNLQQKLSARKWETFDRFLESEAFSAVPEGSRIHYVGLDLYRGIAVTDELYWKLYSKAKSGKQVEFSSGLGSINTATGPTYVLFFDDEPRGYSQSIIFAKIEGNRIAPPKAREFYTIINTENDSAHVTGNLVGCEESPCSAQFSINGEIRGQQSRPWFSLKIATSSGNSSETEIHASQEVDLTTVLVSFSRQNRLTEKLPAELLNKVFADGF